MRLLNPASLTSSRAACSNLCLSRCNCTWVRPPGGLVGACALWGSTFRCGADSRQDRKNTRSSSCRFMSSFIISPCVRLNFMVWLPFSSHFIVKHLKFKTPTRPICCPIWDESRKKRDEAGFFAAPSPHPPSIRRQRPDLATTGQCHNYSRHHPQSRWQLTATVVITPNSAGERANVHGRMQEGYRMHWPRQLKCASHPAGCHSATSGRCRRGWRQKSIFFEPGRGHA